ncbi:MAG: hypothetical protein E7349_07940 [Clostridiales bacterium]|nr:hypothetical protein [Clostridiales bacterium]
MVDTKIGELIDKYGTEIDKNNFRNFILDLVKECGADGINRAKGYFKDIGCLETWDKEVFKIVQQLLGVKE